MCAPYTAGAMANFLFDIETMLGSGEVQRAQKMLATLRSVIYEPEDEDEE